MACKSLPGKSIAEDPSAYLGGGGAGGPFGGGYSNGAASNASKMLPPSCTSGGAASAAPPPHHSQPTRTFNTTPPPPRLDPLSIGLDHFESDHALALELHRLQTLLVLFFGDSNVGLEAATALGERFRGLGQDPRQTMAAATDMIRRSHDSDRAKQYDWYQWKTNGIVP